MMQNVLQRIGDSIREDGRGGVSAHVYPLRVGVIGGALGGLAMVVIALGYGAYSGQGIWYPVNLIAATVMRGWQQAPGAFFMQFHLEGFVIGALLHVLLSIIIGVLFVLLLPTLPGHVALWAVIIGPLLWLGAIYAMLPLLNPVMAREVDLGSFFVAHLLYSLVLGAWVARARRSEPH